MKKKILSFLMAVFLVVTLVPITTSATENKDTLGEIWLIQAGMMGMKRQQSTILQQLNS